MEMTTLSQVLAKLAKEKGIHREFRMNEDNLMKLQDSDNNYNPSDLKIVKTYRFEGNTSSPDDNSVLYVIEDNFGNKGIIIDSYGAESSYSGEEFDDFLRNIPVVENDNYNV